MTDLNDLKELRTKFKAAVAAGNVDEVAAYIAAGTNPMTFSERIGSAQKLGQMSFGEEGQPVDQATAKKAARILVDEHRMK